MALWQVWWVWLVAAAALGIAETLLPGFVAFGFAGGAAVTGVLVWTGLIGATLGPVLLVFALASLVTWALARRLMGVRRGQVKRWDRDINEN
ncbi:hypothetical protein V8J36_05085 [Frigidibacter sp. MR17.14]|uniref:NfeD family protein n=1 Tax=Frigidibacter sp. MR17.14 TaxID=3126509 RepID=UPI003012D761